MKQRIRELLKSATPGGYNPRREEGGSQRRSPGDTYERYTQRCRRLQVESRSFIEWLMFEIHVADPQRAASGFRPPKLDDKQRALAMVEAI